jgi:hypothetical protein
VWSRFEGDIGWGEFKRGAQEDAQCGSPGGEASCLVGIAQARKPRALRIVEY